MNTRILHLIFGLAVLGGLTACNKQLIEEPQAPVNTHRVYFSSSTAQTKTGITVEDGLMTPDWRKTDAANIHLFEIGSKGPAEGRDVEITMSEENKVAHFKADFPTDMTIIVDPSKKNATLNATNEQNVGPYTYAAIVAQAQESAYIVPAVQHPDAETLIDPSADFLIGYSRKSYDAAHNWDEDVVDLYFDRPVALGRINMSGFAGAGEVVKSVVIKAPGLSGSAAYTAIDFENAAVTFTPDEAAEGETAALTLDYGTGAALAEDNTFGAYFVALPGTATVSEIIVTTDQYIYTKTVGKEIAFSSESFKNLKLDLASAEKQEVIQEEIKWYKASVLEDGIDYIIVSGGYALKNNDGTLDTVEISPVDGIITFNSAVDPTIVWRATAKEIAADDDLIAGHFTLSNGENMFLQRVSAGNHEYEMGVGAIPGTVKYYAWDYDGQYLYHVSNSSATFYCFYNSGWTTGYQNQKEVQIYTSRPPVEMSFSQTDVTFDKEGTDPFIAPTLTAPDGVTVTYASSNEAVATVDANGNVTILKAGTTVITAVAAGNADFQAGSASYTLTVTSSNLPTWYPIEVVQDNEEYIIVSNGYVLYNDNGSPAGQSVAISADGTVQLDAQATMLWTATEKSDGFTLTNNGNYLQRSYSSSTWSPKIGSAPSTNNWYMWVYTDGNKLFFQGSSDKYYFYYDAGWKISTTESEAHEATLYSTTKPKTAQHLSFSESSVSALLGQTFTTPTLTGVKTSVSYASSNESVATVDGSTGEVTLVGKGETTITATAPADDEYYAGSASYTLKVTDGNVPKWYLVDEIVGGEYLIVSNGHVLLNNDGSVSSEEVSVNNGVIDYDAPATAIWTAATYGEGYSLINIDKYLRRSSSSLQIGSASSTETNNRWYYNASTQQLTLKGSSSTYYLRYDSSWGISTSSASAALYSTTPPKQAQEISFGGTTSFTFDKAESGATFTAPSLSGAQTTVTYTSSKPAVATVDAATGAIEITGVGTTIITASAEGTDTYKPATATYTLNVIDSSAPVTTKRYVLATEIVDGKDYLIVSGGYALKNDNGSVASVAITPVDGVIEFDSGEDEGLAWTATRETSLPNYGDYVFSNGGNYIRRPSGGGTALTMESATSFTKYFVFLYDGTHFYHHNLGGQNSNTDYVYWLHYDSSWKFAYEATTDPSHSSAKTTLLYVAE
ncbi:MAG: Ig-like domain-containing protein [Bacteroidales bacterium]|nr:Ig-like domain-containing protein [Bacteroidales bacterium]